MTTFNRHYPFAQREFCFVFPWTVTRPTLEKLSVASEIPKGDGSVLFDNDITLLIDEPDLVPAFFPPHYGETKTLTYAPVSTPPGLPSGWSVSLGSEARYIRSAFFVRPNLSGPTDLRRPDRRVHQLDFGITCWADITIVVQRSSPFGDYRINIAGYWEFDPFASPPTEFWETADTPPTLHRLHQRGHRDYHRQFVPADWFETAKTTLSGGTVPTTVSDYMDDWLDDLALDLAGATIDCTWRMAGIGWAIPADLGNRNFIVSSNAGRKY
jgi:hypothetical protein